MKKMIYVSALVCLVSGTSCSKKYDCLCTDSNGTTTTTQVKGVNKDAAQINCVAKSSVGNGVGCILK